MLVGDDDDGYVQHILTIQLIIEDIIISNVPHSR